MVIACTRSPFAESVQNSPKMEVPLIRRSAANVGTTPTTTTGPSSSSSKSKLQGAASGSGVKKQTAQSPAVQKRKSIVRTLTPELIRYRDNPNRKYNENARNSLLNNLILK